MKALGILNKNYHELANYEDESYLDEAIAELEALQLTRREWYQKGYAEAEKALQSRSCEGCVYLDRS